MNASAEDSRRHRAFALNLASAGTGAVTRFLLSLLLARMLAPEELGTFAMACALVHLAQLLRDQGLAAWLQREAPLTQARFSACLGLLAASTGLSALLLLGIAVVAGASSASPLPTLVLIMLPGFVLGPIPMVLAALLQRELAASRLAASSSLGFLAYALVALCGARLGAGAAALAVAWTVNVAICTVVYGRVSRLALRWRPSMQGARSLLPFSLASLGAQAADAFNAALPALLLGPLASAGAVGLLGRALALTGLFQTFFGSALGFGAVRRLSDLPPSALAHQLARSASLITGAAWPLLMLTTLWSPALISLLYGPRWLAAVPAVLPLALMAGLQMSTSLSPIALTAVGRPRLAAAGSAVLLLSRVVLVGLAFDGTLSSFAWALCWAQWATLPLLLALQARHLHLRPAVWAAALAPSLLTGMAVGAAGLALEEFGIVAAGAGALATWLLALRASRHPLLDELWRLRSTMRK